MKPDDFERLLASTPLQPPPAAWRDVILSNARVAAAESAIQTPSHTREVRSWETLLQRLATPWIGIAAAVACGLLLNTAARLITPDFGSTAPRLTREPGRTFAETLRLHRAEILSLADHNDPGRPEALQPATHPKPPASRKPRSDVVPNPLRDVAPLTPSPA